MNISIFGLGYVGSVSAACLAKGRHQVLGVDTAPAKVALINQGQSPVIEADVGELIAEGVREGRLRAGTTSREAVEHSDMLFVCVGTPSRDNGSLDLTYVRHVCEQIGEALRDKDEFCVVVVRSTVLPGTMNSLLIPTLEETSGKTSGKDFGVCFHPEFLREGTAVADYFDPPSIVFAASDDRSRQRLLDIYQDLDAPRIDTDFETAELIKYTNNAWHALKIGFANEIGAISKALGVDGQQVMDILCQDTKLNISKKYLCPGFAFGGSCLPKDLRALNHRARGSGLELPILGSIMPSNQLHIERAFQMIKGCGNRKVGVLGLSFKPGTDDLRESPLVEVVERLLGKGYDIRVYDRNVNLARLVGANRDYIYNHVPHISSLMVDNIDEVMDHAETIVVGYGDGTFDDVLQRRHEGQAVIDLVRVTNGHGHSYNGEYHGICW